MSSNNYACLGLNGFRDNTLLCSKRNTNYAEIDSINVYYDAGTGKAIQSCGAIAIGMWK